MQIIHSPIYCLYILSPTYTCYNLPSLAIHKHIKKKPPYMSTLIHDQYYLTPWAFLLCYVHNTTILFTVTSIHVGYGFLRKIEREKNKNKMLSVDQNVIRKQNQNELQSFSFVLKAFFFYFSMKSHCFICFLSFHIFSCIFFHFNFNSTSLIHVCIYKSSVMLLFICLFFMLCPMSNCEMNFIVQVYIVQYQISFTIHIWVYKIEE